MKLTHDQMVDKIAKLSDDNRVLRQIIQEIKKIADYNAINTCWTILEVCNSCKDLKNCGLQSPLRKLNEIKKFITKAESEDN